MTGDLILMEKDGASIWVHRSCVADYERLLWRVCLVVPDESKPVDEPKIKRKVK